MAITDIPPDWNRDALSEFIETARHNTFATFVNLRQEYSVLKSIHELYKYVIDNLINTPEWFAAFFLLRAHSAYLGGVRLAISGQCAETYMVLRGCIEAAIYGLYLSRNKNSQETWLNRHNNDESRERVKKEFSPSDFLMGSPNILCQDLLNRKVGLAGGLGNKSRPPQWK